VTLSGPNLGRCKGTGMLECAGIVLERASFNHLATNWLEYPIMDRRSQAYCESRGFEPPAHSATRCLAQVKVTSSLRFQSRTSICKAFAASSLSALVPMVLRAEMIFLYQRILSHACLPLGRASLIFCMSYLRRGQDIAGQQELTGDHLETNDLLSLLISSSAPP
jgi:hypothetical protein